MFQVWREWGSARDTPPSPSSYYSLPSPTFLPPFRDCAKRVLTSNKGRQPHLRSLTFIETASHLPQRQRQHIGLAKMAHFRGSVDGTPPRSGFFNSFGSLPSPDGHSMSPEAVHENLLDTALREHNRVREQAIRVFQNNQLREAQLKLLQEERQEKERLRLEQELADDRARIIELRKKTVPIPELPPRVKTPPPPPAPPTPPTPEPPQKVAPAIAQPQAPQQAAVPQAAPVVTQPVTAPQAPQTIPSTIQTQPVTQAPTTTAPITISKESPPYILPGAQRYLEIHQNLKRLRHFIIDNGKKDPGLRKKTGEMRREIRKSVGQLTSGKGATTIPVSLL